MTGAWADGEPPAGAPAAFHRSNESLPPQVEAALRDAVRFRDGRAAMWLADRLKLVSAPSSDPAVDQMARLLDRLTQDDVRTFRAMADDGEDLSDDDQAPAISTSTSSPSW